MDEFKTPDEYKCFPKPAALPEFGFKRSPITPKGEYIKPPGNDEFEMPEEDQPKADPNETEHVLFVAPSLNPADTSRIVMRDKATREVLTQEQFIKQTGLQTETLSDGTVAVVYDARSSASQAMSASPMTPQWPNEYNHQPEYHANMGHPVMSHGPFAGVLPPIQILNAPQSPKLSLYRNQGPQRTIMHNCGYQPEPQFT